MKKLTITIILAFFYFFHLIAQQYQTVYADKISYFKNEYGSIKCIKIDSVKYQNDSIFYPFSAIRRLNENCFTPYGASLAGNKIIINDSVNMFFNIYNDTIKIRTDAGLNESWLTYSSGDSINIMAEVIKHDTLNLLGINDSVKTIAFSVYDETMSPVSHELNNKTILISKKFGFVKTFNFYLYPGYTTYDNKQLEILNLVGISKPPIGIQNLTFLDVYDFEVGDEIHIKHESTTIGADCNDEYVLKKTIKKYIRRMDYADSIEYLVERRQSEYTEWPDSNHTNYVYDTIKVTYKQNTIFDHLPGEPVISGYTLYTYTMLDKGNIIKMPTIKLWYSSDTCWVFPIEDGCITQNKYVKGLGGPYYECSGGVSCYHALSNQLVYYKKDERTGGTPLVVDIDKQINNNDIAIYPNPADDILYIDINEYRPINYSYVFELINLEGKVIKKVRLKNKNVEINISDIQPSLYIYRVISKNGAIIKKGKIIKDNK